MEKLTKRQQQIFDLIQESINETGMPPTRAEIATSFGFRSLNAAEEHLRALERKGVIELLPGASRGIRLAGPSGIPVVGRVAAGTPILAQEHIEDHFRVDASLFSPAADFLLRVEGMSMQDIGILNRDLLAVHKTPEIRNGQIVVARIDDEVTVKEFQKKGNKVTLVAHNADFENIKVDPAYQELVIEGLGVGVIRNGKLAH